MHENKVHTTKQKHGTRATFSTIVHPRQVPNGSASAGSGAEGASGASAAP